MAHQTNFAAQQASKYMHLKYMDLLEEINRNAKFVGPAIMDFRSFSNLLGWGEQIRSLDGMIYGIFMDDPEYIKTRNRLEKEIEYYFTYKRNSDVYRWKIKNLYQEWFRLINFKLGSLGLYPSKEIEEEIIVEED